MALFPHLTYAGASSLSAPFRSLVVLAADISPVDVISHLPVFCEEQGVPYMFVTSKVSVFSAWRAASLAARCSSSPALAALCRPPCAAKGRHVVSCPIIPM